MAGGVLARAGTRFGGVAAWVGQHPHASVVGIALLAWVYAAFTADGSRVPAYGLLEVVPPVAFAALCAMVIGFSVAATRANPSPRVLAAYVVVTTFMLHALPPIVYDNLRASWAWKHVGIVDYIQRFDAVQPGIEVQAVYHNWPGFFGLSAMVNETGGLASSLSYAAWAPLFFNLLSVLALFVLYRAFTTDRRLIWTATLLFVLGNWVGQDYFAPQALAFLLYVVVLAILLRWFRTSPAPEQALTGTARSVMLGVVTVSLVTISISHQLTPVMILISLGLLVVFRVVRPVWPLILSGLVTVGWLASYAYTYVAPNLQKALLDLGGVQDNVSSGIADTSVVSAAQANVSSVARLLTVAAVAMAAIGFARGRRSDRSQRRGVALLAAAPVLLIVVSPYGGEGIFRAYLFALPFLAFLAAQAWFPAGRFGKSIMTAATLAVVGVVASGGFLVSAYGADQRMVFSDQEVAAAAFVFDDAASGSLLIQGSRDYPTQFHNYENLTYVTLDASYEHTVEKVMEDPAGTLADWMADPQYSDAYLLVTKSQMTSTSRLGTLPEPGLQGVVDSVRASADFDVAFENDDAVVFVLAEEES